MDLWVILPVRSEIRTENGIYDELYTGERP